MERAYQSYFPKNAESEEAEAETVTQMGPSDEGHEEEEYKTEAAQQQQETNDQPEAEEAAEAPHDNIDTSQEESEKASEEGNQDENAMEVDNGEMEEKSSKSGTPEPEETRQASYSTRGRAAESGQDPLEKLAQSALGDLAGLAREGKEPTPSSFGPSFLSDALTEEERRTRTRYLPEVDGMHALRKNEIKGDLALARNSGAGGAKKKRSREEGMDVDETESFTQSEDERASDIMRLTGTKTVEIGFEDLTLPSPAFVSPGFEGGSKFKPTPREVESVTAFNPPRPPESVGAKKKHRMLRWERRPADIEVDLSSYRKTVQKTLEELKSAQAERERSETVDNHLRRHFLGHLKCLNEEWVQLSKELATVQQDCVNAADLLTSRTRSRGAGKGSYVMKDVLAVLKARGAEINEKGLSLESAAYQGDEPVPNGAGGVGALSFKDWDCSTPIVPGKVAAAWILPGDKVKCPYGEGTVVAVYPATGLNVKEPPHEGLISKPPRMKGASEMDKQDASGDVAMTDASKDTVAAPTLASSKEQKKSPKASAKKGKTEETGNHIMHALAPRVAVRLPFGVGFFTIDSVSSKENPAAYSDERLALRWKGMVETAISVGATLDIEAMADLLAGEPKDDIGDGLMEIDEAGAPADAIEHSEKKIHNRLLPFGAGLLPTASGRGSLLPEASLPEIDNGIDPALFQSGGVLGSRDNPGKPATVRKREDLRQEQIFLQAKVLQLRNQLFRQRRIRKLNEATYTMTQDRASRVEALVSEMRTDLKSLKNRLDDEIRELGISEEQAESILTSYYNSLDVKHAGEATPPKRPRHKPHEYLETDEDDDMMEPEAPEELNVELLDSGEIRQ